MKHYQPTNRLSIFKRLTNRFTNLSIATLFFATSLAGVSPLLFSSVAHATAPSAITLSASSLTVESAETKTASADTTNYQDLAVSFDYNIGNLEQGDNLEYGWSVGGTDHNLGTLNGETGEPGPNEVGSVPSTAIADASASNSGFSLYFKNTGTSSGTNDEVNITNISLMGVATPATVNISTVAELRNAIENQADGQTWNISPNTDLGSNGNYGLSPFNDITTGGQIASVGAQSGWYFPITASNLTINGIDNPTIYGTGFTANGTLSTENFITIFGNNVTLNGITLMSKVDPNKVIDVFGANSTIENIVAKPNTLSMADYNQPPADFNQDNNGVDRAKQFAGIIYYEGNPGSVSNISNVTMDNGGISFHSPGATLNVNGVTLNYSSPYDDINYMRFYAPEAGNIINGASTIHTIYNVSASLNNIDNVLANIGEQGSFGDDTINLLSDLNLSHQLTINQPVTLNGNGYTLHSQFAYTSQDNNSALSVQNTSRVSIEQIAIDGSGTSGLHGINIFNSSNVNLWRVGAINNSKSGINVNGSQVVATDITTSGNGWDGIDVDKPGAWLKVAGINHYNEDPAVPAIYFDSWNPSKVHFDSPELYAYRDNYKAHGDRAYFPISEVPAVPANFYFNKASSDTTDRALTDGSTTNTQPLQQVISGHNTKFLWAHWDNQPHTAYHIETYFKESNGTWTRLHISNNSKPDPYRFYGFGSRGNGEYKIKVVAYNTQNGLSSAPANAVLYYDTQSPVASFVHAPTNDSFVNGNFDVSGNANDNVRLSGVSFDVRDPSAPAHTKAWRAGCTTGSLVGPTYDANRQNASLNCTINTASLTEGHLYYVRVHASDYAGYGSHDSAPQSIRYFTVDRTAPVIKINNVAPVASYKAGDNNRINVHVIETNLDHVDVNRIDANAPNNDKHWVYHGNYFGLWWLKDGKYAVIAYDKAGNSTFVTFVTDKTKPVVNTNSTSESSPTYNPASFTITASDPTQPNGLASGVAKVTGNIYKFDSVQNKYVIFQGHSSTTANPFTVILSSLSDGKYYVKYNAADGVGNISNTEEFYLVVDHTAPSTPSITAPGARTWHKTTPIDDAWTTSTDATSGIDHYEVAYSYDDGHTFNDGGLCTGLTISGKAVSGCRNVNGTSRNHMPGANEEGGVTIWVRAFDKAGNPSDWSSPVHYYYDHSAPSTTINVSPVVNGVFTVSGTAGDNLALNRVYVQLVYRGDGHRYGGTTINLITNPLSTSKTWSKTYDVNALGWSDGNYAANVEAVDMAGNTFNPGWTNDFTVDTTAPAVPTATLADANGNNVTDNGFINTKHFTFTLTNPSSDGVTRYQLKYWNNIAGSGFNGANHAWPLSNTMLYSTNPVQLSKYVDQFTQGEGTHYFAFSACDAAGNCSSYGSPFVVTYDNTAPLLSNVTASDNGDGTWTISGTTDDASSDVDVALVDASDSSNNASLIATPASDGSWSVKTDTLPAGNYDVSATSTDDTGNTGAIATTNFKVTERTTPETPQQPIINAIGPSQPSVRQFNLVRSPAGPLVQGPFSASPLAASITANDAGNVLGVQTNDKDNGHVKGDQTTKELATNASNKDGSSWSWWWLLPIVIVLVALIWFLLAARRSGDDKA